jgi:hypothetical protein
MEPYRSFRSSVIFRWHCGLGGLPMPDKRLLSLAREARERAEEILVKAETFQDAEAKQRMREIAAKYEEMAERLERAAADM